MSFYYAQEVREESSGSQYANVWGAPEDDGDFEKDAFLHLPVLFLFSSEAKWTSVVVVEDAVKLLLHIKTKAFF